MRKLNSRSMAKGTQCCDFYNTQQEAACWPLSAMLQAATWAGSAAT